VSAPATPQEREEMRDLAAEMDFGAAHRELLCLELIRARRVVRMLRTQRFRRRCPYQVLSAVALVPDLKRDAADAALPEPGADG